MVFILVMPGTIFGVKRCMTISIINAIAETHIVEGVFLVVLLLSIRRTRTLSFFSIETTTELKGLAILMVVLSHIGYFLVSDHQFLVPLSNYAGVGVDLFLILSGYGLVATSLRKPLSIGKFYIKRLARVYVPVLITVAFFLLLNFLWLHQIYATKTIVENLFGFFPNADIYGDINSPLWYITPLLMYYLLFPIIFWRRFPLLSALAMAIIGWWGVKYVGGSATFAEVVFKLYRYHFVAFPVGMALGALINQPAEFMTKFMQWLRLYFQKKYVVSICRWALMSIAGYVFIYIYYHPTYGQSWKREVVASLITAGSIMIIFLFKKINFKILYWFGLFSFEIYLLHWPLLYRYNFLYGKILASVATIIYLGLFLVLGYLYNRGVGRVFTNK
jgi:peptidoglycan/LPS O-acetylase OafA/YrhL